MAAPRRLVAVVVTVSFIFVRTNVSQKTEETPTERQPEVNWEDDHLSGELEALCMSDQWTQAGQLVPGVNFTNILYTVRSAWQAGSLLQVASLVCVQYGPVLNVLSDGLVKPVCEPVIEAVYQGRDINIEGICYQVWQMIQQIQHGDGISFEPPCQKEPTDDWRPSWPDGTQPPWFDSDKDNEDQHTYPPWGKPDSTDYVTLPPWYGGDTEDHDSAFWFDIWEFKQILEESFSSLSDYSGDFCYNFSAVMFNDSIASFDVVDHALHAIFESYSSKVYEKCLNADYGGRAGQEPDAAILVFGYLTNTNGAEDLCQLLQNSYDFSDEKFTDIVESAKNKMFEVLQNEDTCLGLYDTLSPFTDFITHTTGFYLGELVCDYIVSSFDANDDPSGISSGLSFDGTREFLGGNNWTLPEEYGYVLPGIPFQEAVAVFAQVLNSNTASNGMKLLCSVLSPILDGEQVGLCSALEEHDYYRFLESCHNFYFFTDFDWLHPTKDDIYDYPNIEGAYLINEFFQHYYHLQEIASQFNNEIHHHIDVRDILQSVYHSDPVADYEDTCTIVGNVLYESDAMIKDIILSITEKYLILLYHIAPHFCQVPLDPGSQWPGEGDEFGDKFPPDNQWPEDYGHEETWTYDTPNDPDVFFDKNKDTNYGWLEATTDEPEYTTDGKKDPNHYPPYHGPHDDIDPWWVIKIGPFQGKIIEKFLAFLSGFSNEREFCAHAIETFYSNETVYRMQAMEKVQQMKEMLKRAVEEYESCLPMVTILKENLTEYGFHDITGYDSAESLCWDMVNAFSNTGQNPNPDAEFYWPNHRDIFYTFGDDYNIRDDMQAQTVAGELAPGVSVSSLIHFAGQLYNAPVMDGAKLLCSAFGEFMGHFETESCGFLQSSRPKHEFTEYCQSYGTYDDDHNEHAGRHEHHESESSFLAFIPWEHLPTSLSEVFGVPFLSEPMCTLGWDLLTSQSVKTSLQKGFQVLTRLLINATSDVECDSDHEYVTFFNDTHFAIDYLYDYNEGGEGEMDFDFLGVLYSYLGGYEDVVALCTEVKSALEDPEAINNIEAEMTNRLFQLLEDQTECVSFLNLISTKLVHNSAGMTVGKLVGMESNEDFCSSLTGYMTGEKEIPFNDISLFVELTRLSEMGGDNLLINSTLTDNILQLAASVYRSSSIREATDFICPVVEMIPDLDPELGLLDACFYLQTVNATSFQKLCTDNLQYYIPYFWIWVNHNSNFGDEDNNEREDQDYWDNDHDDFGDTNDFLGHVSIYTIKRIFRHTFGFLLFDSTVFCYGIDGWLQANSGADMIGKLFRLFQTVLISQSSYICPTYYYYMSEPPVEQPDLEFGGTDFIDVIGAVNTFLGNYSDYEYLCWDVQTAYLEWDYDGDSTHMDKILDQMTGKFMEVLHDVDQCLALASAMNRLPIVGPVAAQIGFENNEMLCEFVVSQFASTQNLQINYEFLLLLFSDKHEDSGGKSEEERGGEWEGPDEVSTQKWEDDWNEPDGWTQEKEENQENLGDDSEKGFKYLRLGIQEMINILVGIYNNDVAMSALSDACLTAHQLAPNNSFLMEVSFICDQIITDGSIVGTCLDNFLDLFDDGETYYDGSPRATQSTVTDSMSNWMYLQDVISKLRHIIEHVYDMYSGYGLNYYRLEQVAFNIQANLGIGSFNLEEPFSGCSFLRLVLSTNHTTLIDQIISGLAYPIGDFLEYISQFGLCYIEEAATGEENTDIVAYRILKNLLQLFLGMDDAQFCMYMTEDHTLEEYRAQGMLIANKMATIFSDEATCVDVLSVVAAEDRYNMLFNLTGTDLSNDINRLVFCQHLVSSFSGETQYVPTEYTLLRGETLENWQPFSNPGQLLPQLDFSNLVSILGAVYSSPTLLEGTGVLCDVFQNVLVEESDNLGASVEAVCDAVADMNLRLVEMYCLNFTVPGYYGEDYPVNLRPIDADGVGISILLQLLGTAQLTRESEVCPALDRLFSSDWNLRNIVSLVLNTWLEELIPTAAGICLSWDEVIWYLSPMRHFHTYNEYLGDYNYFTNWTTTTIDDGVEEAQELYEHAINTVTQLISVILGYPDRESLCDFIQSGINSTTGVVIKEILATIQTRLSAAFTDADTCTLVIESIIDLLQIELHMIPTLYDITGYESPREFCAVTTEFLADEGCFAEVDCFGVCGGWTRLDCGGVCNGTAREDCTGVCGGKAELDCFGVCEGDAEVDCTGECGGKAILSDCTYECVGGSTGKPMDSGYDECELCTLLDDYKDVRDCAGTCSGTASLDLCGECTGGETGLTFDESRLDCNGECDGTAFEDCLGNCIIAGETGAVEDACGICDGSNPACVFSLGLKGMEAGVETELTVTGEGFNADLENNCVFETFNGTTVELVAMSVFDSQIGVCTISLPEGVYSVYVNVGTTPAGGEPQTIEVWSSCSEGVDCTGVCGGTTVEDCNGLCGGSAVLDCADICGGTLVLDCAGVCGGDTQEDCLGNCNGDTPVDCSGTCNGTAEEDCSGVCQGAAFMNDCGYCVGGTTGRSESLGYDQCGVCKSTDGYVDTRDCHGTCNGQAYVDECGECVGGETGKTSEYETRKDCNDVCDGTWQFDACGICEPDGDISTSKYEDCSNTCIFPGSSEEAAFINVCQECVGGQTGRSENYGLDACGVCGGTNETCKGCDGIPNSNVEYDACGVCGGTGSSCIVVSSLDRNIFLTNEATEVTVSGAGFTSDKVYTCTFSGPEDITTTMTPSGLTSGTFTVTLPQTGAYTFSVLADNDAISVADDATLTVYAINGITIESISPSKPLTSDGPTTFTITANTGAFTTLKELLDVTVYINVYESEASQTPTEVVAASFDQESSNSLIISYSVSDPVQVFLKPYFDGYGELPGDRLELIFYAPSPELTALYFNSLGSAIIAEFGSLVDTSVLQQCSDILADTSKLGTDASCEWRSPQRLIIIIGNGDNLISVGDTLTFKRANIVVLFEVYPYPEDADSVIEMTVAAPDSTPSVRALLYGSSVVSNCGRIKGVLYSQGAAGREFNYQWTVSSSGNTSDVVAALSALSGSTLDIDATLLDAGVDYIISVTVTNFFGGSDTTSLTVQRSARETPDVIVNAIGIDTDNAYLSESAVLVADIFYSECAPAGDTIFSWSVDSDEVALSLKRSSRNLFIPANSLPGGTSVTFTVRIYKSSEPDNYVEESITITTRYSDLEPHISQGKFITVGQDNGNVELDGTLSRDPDSVALLMTYEWQCEQITDNTACWSYKSGHTGETILENANPTAAILTFDAEHMDVNKIYMFTLIVRKGLRNATTFIYVTPVAGTPPEISITPVTGSQLSGEVLAIQATIRHTSALSQAVWSTTDTDSGNGYVDLTDSNNFITSPHLRPVGSDRSFSFFALQKNVLAPGATYSFKLSVTTEDDKTSEATVEVRVRSIITSCVISLDDGSSSYTELESIILAVDSCTTDEDAYPLTFQVFLQNTDGSYEAKTAAEASDRIAILGPPALLTNNDIPYNTFQVKVCDKFKVCATFRESFNVDSVQLDQTEVTSAVENLVEVEEARQNYEKALVNINMLVIRLGSESVANSLTTSSRRKRAVEETSKVNQRILELGQNNMDNNVLDTRSAELQMSEMSVFNTDNSTQDDMETLVDQYSDLVDVFTEADESIPEVTSVKMLEKLKEIKNKVPSTASRIREKISNLTSNLEKTHFRGLQLGGEERKTETGDSKLVLKRDIPQARMTFDSSFSVKIAADIISNFGAGWNCSSGSCSGVTFRFKLYNESVDEYSVTAEDIANRAAAIVEFSLHDPDSDDELTISDLTDAVSFNLTITRPQDNAGYECRFWNSTSSEWSSDGLTSVQIEADVVTCESYHLSTFTVVVVEPLTTVAPTTQQGSSSQDEASTVHTNETTPTDSAKAGEALPVDTDVADTNETTPTESVKADETSSVGTDETTPTESVKTENGSDENDDSSTQGNTPLPSGGGNGVVIGIIVGVVVLVLVGAAVIGVFAFIKMKGGNNKVTSEGNFEAAHPAPVPSAPPLVAPPAEADVSVSPRRAETPVAFETADPVAVPLKAEPNMPPPPSVFVPPGDEATVVTETEPPHHPHSPEPTLEPEMEESSNNLADDPPAGANPNEDVQASDSNLPEPSE